MKDMRNNEIQVGSVVVFPTRIKTKWGAGLVVASVQKLGTATITVKPLLRSLSPTVDVRNTSNRVCVRNLASVLVIADQFGRVPEAR